VKVLITGGSGMVGSAFKRIETDHELILLSRKDADLLDQEQFKECLSFHNPDAVIHLAAKVGGVKGNTDFVSDFFYENVLINTNVLEACRLANIGKVVSLLSTCVYPDIVSYPLTEDQIHGGEPHVSNFGYAYAKRMLEVHSRAIRKQYGKKYVCAVPNNLYGPNDNFDLENGHVIPSIIRKIWEAKDRGVPPVFWGTGKSLREFTFSEDIATALLFLMENYEEEFPVNIGSTEQNSIQEVVKKVCKLLQYNGDVVWDSSMPSGQYKKPSCNKRFLKLGWDSESYHTLDDGLEKTVSWFTKKYPDIRGI
jgi:GDP-L-fucose synthase